jgi:hypothetical protein
MNILFKPLIFVGSLLAVGVQPVFAQELERGKDGTLACVGNHELRRGGTEITFTSYTFRNFNADNAITITNIIIFDANGVALKDMPGRDPFPASLDFKDLIGPNQTSNFNTRDANLFEDGNIGGGTQTPLQTVVKWTATERGAALYGVAGRQDRGRDPANGNNLEQRARAIARCVSLK